MELLQVREQLVLFFSGPALHIGRNQSFRCRHLSSMTFPEPMVKRAVVL